MIPSAGGKFILGGEHSVVHRGYALSFPLPSLRLRVDETEAFDGLRINGELRSVAEFEKILELRRVLGVTHAPRGFDVHSEIPIGGGLGSSAALCTALVKRHRPELDAVSVAKMALEGERLFHGKPSGVDPYTIALERPIAYRAADQSWRALDLSRLRAENLCFVLRDSGLRHRTSEVIQAVSSTRTQSPARWESIMDTLAGTAERMIAALEQNPFKELGPLMNESHTGLRNLGVSCDELDRGARDLLGQGALGAKLTGAGRGGFVLGLFRAADVAALDPVGLIVTG